MILVRSFYLCVVADVTIHKNMITCEFAFVLSLYCYHWILIDFIINMTLLQP